MFTAVRNELQTNPDDHRHSRDDDDERSIGGSPRPMVSERIVELVNCH